MHDRPRPCLGLQLRNLACELVEIATPEMRGSHVDGNA